VSKSAWFYASCHRFQFMRFPILLEMWKKVGQDWNMGHLPNFTCKAKEIVCFMYVWKWKSFLSTSMKDKKMRGFTTFLHILPSSANKKKSIDKWERIVIFLDTLISNIFLIFSYLVTMLAYRYKLKTIPNISFKMTHKNKLYYCETLLTKLPKV